MKKINKLLGQLTIVTMSYNRPEYLYRSLQYWSGKGPNVVVFDGSKIPLDSKKICQLSNNIKYYHSPVSYKDRFAMVENYLKTPYVTLLADDDFYLPSSLAEAIKFLNLNDDYSACCSRPIGFNYSKANGLIAIPGVYDDMNNNYSIKNSNPGDRMKAHMERYMPSTMYAVLRSKNWKHIVEPYVKYEFPVFAIMEFQMELTIAYIGKSTVLPILGWLKSTELDQINGPDLSLQRNVEFHELWGTTKDRNNFKEQYIDYMAKILSKIDKRPLCVVSKEVEDAMNKYIIWWKNYCEENISFFNIRESLKKNLPLSVVKMITNLLTFFRNYKNKYKQEYNLIEFSKILFNKGTYVNEVELRAIETHIQNFYNIKK